MIDEAPTRIGVIGFGKMGILQGAIFNALEGARLVAVTEPNPVVLKTAQRVFSHIRFHANHLSMIEREELDAIVVTSPIASHSSIILSILQQKPLHVFVEKPLTGDESESRTLAQIVEARGVVHAVGYVRRFNPVFLSAKESLDRGAVGRVRTFRATALSGDILSAGRGWRFSRKGRGGVLSELGVHVLDLLLWFFGDPLDTSTEIKRLYSSEVEDYCRSSFVYRDGLRGDVEVCWSMQDYRVPEVSIEIQGDRGAITVNDDSFKSRFHGTDIPATSIYRAGLQLSVPYLLGEQEYSMQAGHFLNCIWRGNRARVDFGAGLAVDTLLGRMLEEAVVI